MQSITILRVNFSFYKEVIFSISAESSIENNGDVTVGNFILFIGVEICLIGMFIGQIHYFSTFAYKVYFDNDNIVFQFKNKTYTYNRNDCKKIFTNVMITKFTFYNKKIRCAKNDYFDDNTGQLKDKLNKEFFPNADITKIWD